MCVINEYNSEKDKVHRGRTRTTIAVYGGYNIYNDDIHPVVVVLLLLLKMHASFVFFAAFVVYIYTMCVRCCIICVTRTKSDGPAQRTHTQLVASFVGTNENVYSRHDQ